MEFEDDEAEPINQKSKDKFANFKKGLNIVTHTKLYSSEGSSRSSNSRRLTKPIIEILPPQVDQSSTPTP
jgi:hypothetical protein